MNCKTSIIVDFEILFLGPLKKKKRLCSRRITKYTPVHFDSGWLNKWINVGWNVAITEKYFHTGVSNKWREIIHVPSFDCYPSVDCMEQVIRSIRISLLQLIQKSQAARTLAQEIHKTQQLLLIHVVSRNKCFPTKLGFYLKNSGPICVCLCPWFRRSFYNDWFTS